MIYQQPVRHEYHLIAPPTLLIVGAEDHVVPLGNYAKPQDAARLGDFVTLSAEAARDIPHATRVVIPNAGISRTLRLPASSSINCCRSSRAEAIPHGAWSRRGQPPPGRVVPSLAGSSRPVVTAAHRHQDSRLPG